VLQHNLGLVFLLCASALPILVSHYMSNANHPISYLFTILFPFMHYILLFYSLCSFPRLTSSISIHSLSFLHYIHTFQITYSHASINNFIILTQPIIHPIAIATKDNTTTISVILLFSFLTIFSYLSFISYYSFLHYFLSFFEIQQISSSTISSSKNTVGPALII
jgi:hypothetical protein